MTISFTSNLGFIKNSFHGAYAKISVYAKMVAVKSILERSAFLELLNLHRKSMKTNENSWHLNEKYSNNVRKKLKWAFLEKIEMIHIFQPSPSLVLCLQYHSRNKCLIMKSIIQRSKCFGVLVKIVFMRKMLFFLLSRPELTAHASFCLWLNCQ